MNDVQIIASIAALVVVSAALYLKIRRRKFLQNITVGQLVVRDTLIGPCLFQVIAIKGDKINIQHKTINGCVSLWVERKDVYEYTKIF